MSHLPMHSSRKYSASRVRTRPDGISAEYSNHLRASQSVSLSQVSKISPTTRPSLQRCEPSFATSSRARNEGEGAQGAAADRPPLGCCTAASSRRPPVGELANGGCV